MKTKHILTIATTLFSGVFALSSHAAVISITSGASAANRQSFDVANDRFELNTTVFTINGPIEFASAAGGNAGQFGISDNSATFSSTSNFIVLRNFDNNKVGGTFPANWDNSFNARNALRAIAANTDGDRAGFFLYWNEALGVNRLVYTANLNNGEEPLQVLFAQNSTNLTGPVDLTSTGTNNAVLRPEANANFNLLSNFTAANVSVIPEPSSALLAGLALVAGVARRKRH